MPRTGFVWVMVLLGFCPSMFAQVPTPAAITKGEESAGGFTPGWTLGARFEGSISDDGGIYDLGAALGSNFSRHLGVDFGLPFYFLDSPSSTKENNPGTVSGMVLELSLRICA